MFLFLSAFRIAHELNIDNFLSPKVEDRHILDPTDTNQQSSPNADVLYHPEYHSQNVFNSKDKPFGANTTRKDVCTDEVESGGFTLTLTRRPEKRERSRSGSDVLSPEPKRVGPGHDEDICTTTEQHVCLDNNGNNSPNRSDGDSEGFSKHANLWPDGQVHVYVIQQWWRHCYCQKRHAWRCRERVWEQSDW